MKKKSLKPSDEKEISRHHMLLPVCELTRLHERMIKSYLL